MPVFNLIFNGEDVGIYGSRERLDKAIYSLLIGHPDGSLKVWVKWW